MKIYEGRNENGQLVFFEVPSSFLTRKAAVRIIREIPGSQILKEKMGEDVFCTFKLGGRIFELMEPFGDNSRFHIGEAEAQYSPELQLCIDIFSGH